MKDVFQDGACIVTLAGALAGIFPAGKREDHGHSVEREPLHALDQRVRITVRQATTTSPVPNIRGTGLKTVGNIGSGWKTLS